MCILSVCIMYTKCVLGGQKGALDTLELSLPTVVFHHGRVGETIYH